jgi:peroxiredoxin (alkyl hydroperoxide reductase subunit C)
VLFSHPADFTPVCTTEFMAFAKAFPEFQKRGVEIIGLSIDSVFSHIAWVSNIEEKFGVSIPFPVIADLDMKVATAYGMVHPDASDTQAVRAVFFIDPEQKLRAMIYYPLANGRSIKEILRLIDSLQTGDKHNVATPEGWEPGQQVIVKPPATHADAKERLGKPGCVDWYFTQTRSLTSTCRVLVARPVLGLSR